MQTIDIHTHLLNPQVRFDRLFDRFSVRFFAKRLGVDPAILKAEPYRAYVETMARSVRESRYVQKTCLFGVDSRFSPGGKEIERDRTVCAMTEDVLAVTRQYPDSFIPFFSVHPYRPDALALIDQFADNGCQGGKVLQNYWGIDLNDKRFIPYYEKLQSRQLPLIVHIGSEFTIHSDRRYEGVEMLELPLACGVQVIAAHMGLGRIEHRFLLWRNLSRDPAYFDADYFHLLEKLRSHQNLYADISAILVPMRARALRHLSEQSDVHHKILFGSDYPVPYTIRFNSYDIPTRERRHISSITNPFDCYITAILHYFSPDSPIYRNYRKLLPRLALLKQI